jgi:hypothetical protein
MMAVEECRRFETRVTPSRLVRHNRPLRNNAPDPTSVPASLSAPPRRHAQPPQDALRALVADPMALACISAATALRDRNSHAVGCRCGLVSAA